MTIARTDANLKIHSIFSAIGTICLLYMIIQVATTWPIIVGFIIVAGWILYLFWYSKFSDRQTSLLAVGKQLPNFVLENEKGQKVESKSLLGNPSIFLFYRGN